MLNILIVLSQTEHAQKMIASRGQTISIALFCHLFDRQTSDFLMVMRIQSYYIILSIVSNPGFILVNGCGSIYLSTIAIPTHHLTQLWVSSLLKSTLHSPPPPVSLMFSALYFTFIAHSPQTSMPSSKPAPHPFSPHARTTALHSPLPIIPLTYPTPAPPSNPLSSSYQTAAPHTFHRFVD